MSWWRSSSRADRGEISTPTLPVALDLPPHKYEHGTGRGHSERVRRERERNGTGQRQILRGAEVSLLSAKLQEYKLYTPRWREASRQSIRFDEKQFEQRMKWQEFLIRIMACCPHALTAPGEMCLWSQDMRRPLCSLWVSELHNYNRETDMSVLLRVGRGFVISEAPSQKPDLRYRIIDKLFRS